MTGIELAIALAALIGISLGILGAGGSMVTMPVLVYVAGVDPKKAVVMSLAIVGGTSLVGSYLHYRENNFHGKAASLFAISGIGGAYFGGMLTHLIRPSVLMLTFAGLMLIVGTLMLVRRRDREGLCECVAWRCLVAGALLGALTGFLGVGGGFLIVPALLYSAAGLIGQLRYTQIDWRLTAFFLIASLVGMGFGLLIVRRVPAQRIRLTFACALLVLGSFIAYRNF
jgi:uncharacterized protein